MNLPPHAHRRGVQEQHANHRLLDAHFIFMKFDLASLLVYKFSIELMPKRAAGNTGPAEHAEITEGKKLGKSSLQVKISLELRAW
jgi:hypothetical protein